MSKNHEPITLGMAFFAGCLAVVGAGCGQHVMSDSTFEIETDDDTDDGNDDDTDDAPKIYAFPGAEGGGANSVGGRGGRVIEVTNLNDSGSGSLREALEASGPRTVVFRVGGTIVLQSTITITESYLTIAGQSAPGDGILIRSGDGVSYSAIEIRNCHDIIIRYLRVRPGGLNVYELAEAAIAITDDVHDVIIDHCSLSWASAWVLNIWSAKHPAYNITCSWSIIAEGLMHINGQSCGVLTGSDINSEQMRDISIHHNLFAHNNNRNPLMKVASGDVVNNIVYGWGSWGTGIGGGIIADIIGNKYVRQEFTEDRREVLWKPYNNDPETGAHGDPSIYFEGNIGSVNDDPDADAWDTMMEMTDLDHWGWPEMDGEVAETSIPLSYRRYIRRFLDVPISLDSALDLDDVLLDSLGACRRLDDDGQWQFIRDSVDARIVQEYLDGTGVIPYDVGDYPVVLDGTPYTDNDHDGMADAWEITHGLNPDVSFDANGTDLSPEGYTNLEMFINGGLGEAAGKVGKVGDGKMKKQGDIRGSSRE